MASDIQILDNPTPTFVQVAEKVVLSPLPDLDEFERRLTLYLVADPPEMCWPTGRPLREPRISIVRSHLP